MLAMLAAGAALLALILVRTDLSEVAARLVQVGVLGMLAIVAIHALGYLSLALSWLYAIRDAPLRARWIYHLWKILMVGTAIDTVTPLAGFGGEPAKAILLKRSCGVPYPEAAASLVIARMTDLASQVIFIAIGFALVLRGELLEPAVRAATGAALLLFALVILLFFLVQRGRGLSRLRAWLERSRLAKHRLFARVDSAFDVLVDVEDQLVGFYSSERRRFVLSVLGAFGDWCSGAVAVWITMSLLGYPVSAPDALVIEAFVILVRSTFFFVPGDVGTQEAAQVLICTAVAGSPAIGLALAAVRRGRDLLWVAWGLAIGWRYSLQDGGWRLDSESSLSR